MSESRAFCPRCGDPLEGPPEDELPGVRGRKQRLCDSCYLEEFDLVEAPDRIEVRVCAECGAVHRGDRWVDVGARDYTDVAIEEARDALAVHVDAEDVSWGVEPEQVDATTVRMHCLFSGVVRGRHVEEEVVVPVKISRGTCTRCGRIAGDYYAGVVQVRATDRAPGEEERDRAVELAGEVVAEMEATGDREAFVTAVEEHADGIDVKVSTTKIGAKVARRLVEEFGGDLGEHETLVTENEDGEEVYRVTYAVRLPPFRAGDVIDPGDGEGPVLVTGVGDALTGTRLESGEPYAASHEDGAAPDAERLGTVADAVETPLVAVEPDAIQVLDPETYGTRTIPRPAFVDADADEVPVFKSRAGLHPVPPGALEARSDPA